MGLHHLGHRNGDPYFFKSGGFNGEDCPGPGSEVMIDVRSGMSKSK